MVKNNHIIINKPFILLIFLLPVLILSFPLLGRAQVQFVETPHTLSDGFICELGITHYNAGKFNEALMDFKKALLINPANKTAKDYINKILARQEKAPKESAFKADDKFITKAVTQPKEERTLIPSLSKVKLTREEYLGLIKRKINSYIVYPDEAKINGWEGVAVVKLTIKRDGSLKKAGIAKSSGYPQLDEATMSAVRKASPYPSLAYYPERYDELEIVLPVNYGGVEPAPKAPQEPAPIPPPEPFLEEEITSPQQAQPVEEEFLAPTIGEKPARQQPGGPAIAQKLETVEDFIELAIQNNQPTAIARQEIELAKFKVREAERNLYPAIKLTGYDTQGEVFKVDYEEREVKAQLDHPIFYGGRLINSLRQARVNLEITQRNYDRQKIDVAHKADVAYYNLMGSLMNIKRQEEIRDEAKKYLDIVEKQFEGELIIPLDYLSAQSWYEQVNFQIDSTQHDLALAKLAFIQVLNIPEVPAVKQEELEIKKLDLDLNQALEIGGRSRPERHLSQLLVQFNQYAKKIEDSKNSLAVQLTSSYGSYEGAYKTESMQRSDNWYVGFKATKPLGASSANASFSSESTQPRFGQTSPTKSSTLSGELNLLDSLALISENKKAAIELKRAESDLNETTKTINYEIKDAYLNSQKSLLQATTARREAEFRRKEVENLKVRAQVGESSFSSVIEALVGLSRAQTNYAQAMANYYIALANLKKATGYGIKI